MHKIAAPSPDSPKISPAAPLIVLGLDGLPLALAEKLAEEGVCPALARLLPHARTVRAEIPALSPVNWTSFFTAAGPEEHGVFGFTRIDPESYEFSIANFSQVSLPTLWDRLGEHGIASRVINLPNTWPVRPLKGMMVSGFVTPSLERAFYPPFLAGMLGGYIPESDTRRAVEDPLHLLRGLSRSLASRRKAFEMLWPDQAWRLFILVLTETDRLFHFLWEAVVDRLHPLHPACVAFLREWDACIGLVVEAAACLEARIILLADHGFEALVAECDCNSILRGFGLLIQSLPPESAPEEPSGNCISPQSAAFALDPGRIYLHTRRRFKNGTLSDEEAACLLPRLREQCLNLTRFGAPVFSAVLPAEELYKGPMLPYAPDLVCLPKPGMDLKAKFNRPAVFGHFGRSGTHAEDGAIFYDTENARPERLRDTGRLVPEHFGIG